MVSISFVLCPNCYWLEVLAQKYEHICPRCDTYLTMQRADITVKEIPN